MKFISMRLVKRLSLNFDKFEIRLIVLCRIDIEIVDKTKTVDLRPFFGKADEIQRQNISYGEINQLIFSLFKHTLN